MRKLTEKQQKTLKQALNGVWHKGFGTRIAQRFLDSTGAELDRLTCLALIDRGALSIKKDNPFAPTGRLVIAEETGK